MVVVGSVEKGLPSGFSSRKIVSPFQEALKRRARDARQIAHDAALLMHSPSSSTNSLDYSAVNSYIVPATSLIL